MASRRSVLALLSVVIGISRAGAEPCTGYTDIIFCDDFDAYCAEPPCQQGDPADQAAFLAEWPNGDCGDVQKVDLANPGWSQFGVVSSVGNQVTLSQHVHDLAPDVAATDPAKNAVLGTDEHPLELHFKLEVGSTGHYANDIYCVELALDEDRAPMNITRQSCSPDFGNWAKIAWRVPVDGTVHASLAFGLNAMLDQNPCDVGTGRAPTMYQAVVFDGLAWHDLYIFNSYLGLSTARTDLTAQCNDRRADVDFDVADGWNHFTMIVRTQTIELRLQNSLTQCRGANGILPTPYASVVIPRNYHGVFNKIAAGAGKVRDVSNPQNPVAPSCITYNDHAIPWNLRLDPMVLSGTADNLTYIPREGACCRSTGVCTIEDQMQCVNAMAGTFGGLGSTCDEVECCPSPPYLWADSDADGDVDMDDFGRFQVCFNSATPMPSSCRCFDHAAGAGVDGIDFTEFVKCTTGANVPYDLGNLQNGCTP